MQLNDETRDVLTACVELIERGHPEFFATLVAKKLVRDDYIGWISWDEERRVEKLLAALVETGLLAGRKAPIGTFYDFPDLEKMNEARDLLGRPPGAPHLGQAKPGAVSAPAQEVLKTALELYDQGRYEFVGQDLDEHCPLQGDSLHQAILELIETGHLDLRSPAGELHYSLLDVPSARAAAKRPATPTPPRQRLSSLALYLGESV